MARPTRIPQQYRLRVYITRTRSTEILQSRQEIQSNKKKKMRITPTFPLSDKVTFNGEVYLLYGITKRIRILVRSPAKFLEIINHPFLKETHLNVKVTKGYYQIDLPETYAMLYHNNKLYRPQQWK